MSPAGTDTGTDFERDVGFVLLNRWLLFVNHLGSRRLKCPGSALKHDMGTGVFLFCLACRCFPEACLPVHSPHLGGLCVQSDRLTEAAH